MPLPLSGPTQEPEQRQSLHSHSSSARPFCGQRCPPKPGPVPWAWHVWDQRRVARPASLGFGDLNSTDIHGQSLIQEEPEMRCDGQNWPRMSPEYSRKLQVWQDWVNGFIRQNYSIVWERGNSDQKGGCTHYIDVSTQRMYVLLFLNDLACLPST